MKEQTLILLKPDAVEQRLEHRILFEIYRLELSPVRVQKMQLSEALVTEHYSHHAKKPYFPGICAYMTRGPVIAMVIEGENAIAKIRELAGATDPTKAAPHTLRGRFGKKLADGGMENVIHASERPEDAAVEIRRFFGKPETWFSRLLQKLFQGRDAKR